MDTQQTDAGAPDCESGMPIQSLDILTPKAKEILSKREEDGFSYEDLLPRNYFEAVGRVIFYGLDEKALGNYVGIDDSAPRGAKTICAHCLSNAVCDRVADLYPDDEHIQYLLWKWSELEEAASQKSLPKKRPAEIVSLKKEFYSVVASWGEGELCRIHDIFSNVRKSLGELPETFFIPRYVARIHMRETDGEIVGQIQKKGESDIRNGDFVAIVISSNTCFSRIGFSLGFGPGCHVVAACGNPDDFGGFGSRESHLHQLRNIRMVLKSDVHRHDQRRIERWGLLYSQTYESANEIKKLKDADAKNSPREVLEDIWRGKNSFNSRSEMTPVWVTGAELEKELGQPDTSLRHTVRAVALRVGQISGEWELLTVTERGDNPGERTGKPPLVGVPGGMREKDATIRQTLCRETENESQTKSVEKIVALVALHLKNKRHDSDMQNLDHWFYVRLDKEAGLSKKMIEGDEIYAVRWIPLSELATCGFQQTRQKGLTVWDVRKVHEQRLFSLNHAVWISKIIPTIPDIKLPANWNEFLDSIRRFQSENAS